VARRVDEPPVDIGFVRLVLALLEIGSVQRIAYSVSRHLHLWVFLREENIADEDAVYDLERVYLARSGAVSFELHVAPLDKMNQEQLPPTETIVER
jgi:hypothetical protein